MAGLNDPFFQRFQEGAKTYQFKTNYDWLRGMSEKERKETLDVMESAGLIAPRDRGFFGEAGKGFNRAFIGG